MARDWTTVFAGSTDFEVVDSSPGSSELTLEYVTFSGNGETVRDRLEALDVAETTETVTIEVRQRIEADTTLDGSTMRVSVRVDLKKKLGGRRVVHAATTNGKNFTLEQTTGSAFPLSGVGDGANQDRLWDE